MIVRRGFRPGRDGINDCIVILYPYHMPDGTLISIQSHQPSKYDIFEHSKFIKPQFREIPIVHHVISIFDNLPI